MPRALRLVLSLCHRHEAVSGQYQTCHQAREEGRTVQPLSWQLHILEDTGSCRISYSLLSGNQGSEWHGLSMDAIDSTGHMEF